MALSERLARARALRRAATGRAEVCTPFDAGLCALARPCGESGGREIACDGDGGKPPARAEEGRTRSRRRRRLRAVWITE
jgi:hypothetical protein